MDWTLQLVVLGDAAIAMLLSGVIVAVIAWIEKRMPGDKDPARKDD